MIVNVIDLREKLYRWKSVLAVVESAAKNNEAADADKVDMSVGVEIDYAERENISVRDAFLWAEGLQGKVTLYLHDTDQD
ncbi:MAG: hypothetical protein AAFY06_12635 [Pseudomonadota bacterium]